VPFRLLGLVVDPSRAGELCGHSFAYYASVGVEVTLACLVSGDEPPPLGDLDRLGIRNLAMLGFDSSELTAAELEPVLCDLIAGLLPHVVVADSSHEGLAQATASAFKAARHRVGGTGALPAKLYVRSFAPARPHEVTSAVTAPALPAPELFARIYPRPWVTGVVERDLFAGITPEPQMLLDELLAS
jgi:LmbE family N-acetylglucosaminyl deacetylase